MSIKLEKIAAERARAQKKRDEWEAKVKELDQKYREQENTEIHDMVHGANLSPEQLAVLLAQAKNMLPDPEKLRMTSEKETEDVENDD